MRKPTVVAATSGALGLSGFAATLGLCCVGPWAVSLLGVGGAIALARLSFLLPYAVIGSVIMTAVAFGQAYGPATACEGPSCTTNTRRVLRVIVLIAALLVGVLSVIALTFRVTV